MTDRVRGFSVVIPGQPPSINRLHELHTIRGMRQRAWSAEFYAYRDMVSRMVEQAKPRDWKPPEYLPKQGLGLLVIEIDLHLKHDLDADNILKPLIDGIKVGLGTHVVYARKSKIPRVAPVYDDSGFLPRFMSKRTSAKVPRVELMIREYDDGT